MPANRLSDHEKIRSQKIPAAQLLTAIVDGQIGSDKKIVAVLPVPFKAIHQQGELTVVL